jgi:monovalent cation/proton antiporter MnhG/PhaG subunit
VSARHVAELILVSAGVGVVLLSCLGVLLMRDAFDRLHYTGPAATLGTVLIVAAVVVREGVSQIGAKSILLCLVIVVTNPVLASATARAARVRQFGRWTVLPDEHVPPR